MHTSLFSSVLIVRIVIIDSRVELGPQTSNRQSMTANAAAKQVEDLVDLNKPILSQIGPLGHKYDQWVHTPSLQKGFRLFHSNFLEYFSKSPWFIVPIIWVPVALLLAFISFNCTEATLSHFEVCSSFELSKSSRTPVQLLFWFFFGVISWTFIEYTIHRFIFHALVSTSPFWVTFHFIMHGQHHKFPLDKGRLVFPPVPAAIIFSLLFALFLSIFELQAARAFTSGIVASYIMYDLTHYYIHHSSPTFSYFSRQKAFHMLHHFKDHNKGMSHNFFP